MSCLDPICLSEHSEVTYIIGSSFAINLLLIMLILLEIVYVFYNKKYFQFFYKKIIINLYYLTT